RAAGREREDRAQPPHRDLLEAAPQQPYAGRPLRAEGGHRHAAGQRRGVREAPARAGLAQRLVDLVALLAETPAPTFGEEARAQLVVRLWREAGLEPRRDAAGNVVADVPGGSGPRVVVASHLDTVFPEGTDVTVHRDGSRLAGPGVGDDAAGLAILTAYLQELPERRPRLVVAATVGEEGAGDLRGARQLVADLGG